MGDVSGASNLPYAAKYQKSNSTSCSKCYGIPNMEELLLGIREFCHTQGHVVDRWYHSHCFFVAMKQKGLGVNEGAIRGMGWLKWDDQESVRTQIEAFNAQSSSCSPANMINLGACRAEHAKSSRGKCGTCKANIKEGEAKYFCKGAHHHLGCFLRPDVKFMGLLENIQGYSGLKQEAKDELKTAFDLHKSTKKVKHEVKTEANTGTDDTQHSSMSNSNCSMGGGDGEGKRQDPLLHAARMMAKTQKITEMVVDVDGPSGSVTTASAVIEDDEEVQLVDVVKSDKPRVITIGEVEMKPIEAPPPPKPKTGLNALFNSLSKAGKSSSLSSVMETLPKKPRLEEEMGKEELNEQLKKQADALWLLREQFERVRDQDIGELMRMNEMHVPKDHEKLVLSIVDAALFGSPGQCPKCPDGRLEFNTDVNTYVCTGNVTEWTKCTYTNKNPTRCPLGIPRSLGGRLTGVQDTGVMNTMTRRFYTVCNEDQPSQGIRKGVPSVDISAEMVEGGRNKRNQVASMMMINPAYMQGRPGLPPVSTLLPTVGKQFIKRGTVVDGESEYASVAHVYRDEEGTLFSCSLTETDMATNRNSYFKMQLLQHDIEPDRYYVFKSWGRVGTEIGDKATTHHSMIFHAKKEFIDVFVEKTGNDWTDRKYFRKRPGKMAMVDMDYEMEQSLDDGVIEPGTLTKLEKPIQQLILRIFDENMFKSALKSFNLDMDQMPLGKLSKRQLDLAYGVLNELQKLVESSSDRSLIVDATNRFYSLIPHNFGHKQPVMLDTKEIIEKKSKLIENLMEIAIAVDLMKGEGKTTKAVAQTMDPIDVNYLKLKSEITILPKSSPEYDMIVKYANNSHGSTHATKIQITDIFCVNREGEAGRFKKHLGNRMLLWHGSRVSNFVGIISQGLRIAPPEAPHAGYMFGKGIYFADMVSKSANYCHPDGNNTDAFLLLCDVALGSVQEEFNATSVNPLRNGCTAVKGIGYQFPDPSTVFHHQDGYVIPSGKSARGEKRICLEYNEFIVYDVSQVRIRYLVRTKMTFR